MRRWRWTEGALVLVVVGCASPRVTSPDGAGPREEEWPEDDAGFALPPPSDGGLPDSRGAQCGQLAAVVRDFRTDHPDFEKDALNVGVPFPGLVAAALGPDRKPIYAPAGPTPATTGRQSFDEWYRDVPGVNLRLAVSLSLTEARPGVFVYDNQAFFPADGQGWPGDDRLGHNFAFTTELHTTFKYKGGERFTFTGDDDVFVFVNGQLALDLGGVHATASGTIDLDGRRDALGLALGGSYPLDVFHAERHTKASTFRIETSIECLRVVVD
jgi:fibro-slime domain-containing protein